MYPLALGAEWSEDGWTLIYGMPELPGAEGQEKEESQNSVLSIKGNDFDEIEKIYNRSQEKYLDMGHLQVLILKNQLVQSEYWKELLAYLEKEPLIGENVYVFRSEYPEQIVNIFWEFLRTESRSRKKMVLHCGRYTSSIMKTILCRTFLKLFCRTKKFRSVWNKNLQSVHTPDRESFAFNRFPEVIKWTG